MNLRPGITGIVCSQQMFRWQIGYIRESTCLSSSIIAEGVLQDKKMHFFPLLAVFVGGEIVDMISNTGAVAKLVLLSLLVFSLISWAIILTKWSLLRRARAQSGRFVRAFRKAQRLQDIAAVAEQFKPSPLVGVFEGGYEEYKRQAGTFGTLRNLVTIQRGMQIGASEEITRLERNLPWLAITAAVTPFVGLFGTVWGIIDAFHGLGTAGAATLRAVAPGISEALITTAAGLAAAIPAVIAYNLIGASIREFAARSDDFALEVLNAVEHSQAQASAQIPSEVRR
jgi:biopolymer transport protein TolQ